MGVEVFLIKSEGFFLSLIEWKVKGLILVKSASSLKKIKSARKILKGVLVEKVKNRLIHPDLWKGAGSRKFKISHEKLDLLDRGKATEILIKIDLQKAFTKVRKIT